MEKFGMELSEVRAGQYESSNSILDLSLGFKLDASATSTETCFKKAAIAAPGGVPSKTYACNYCKRKFYSSQALGGHQNAHKRERTISKQALRIDTAFAKSASMSALPLHGSSFSSRFSSLLPTLPIKVHSVNRLHDQSEGRTTFNCGLNFIETVVIPDDGVEEEAWHGSFRKKHLDGLINSASPAPDTTLFLPDQPDLTLRL